MVKSTRGSGPTPAEGTNPADVRRARYGTLPRRPAPDELVEETPTAPPDDPQLGRDSDRDWMLRYG
jgi:hypothetical protein